MREIEERLEPVAKAIREIRMSDGDNFGTALYATDSCPGPTAGEALQQMHELSQHIARAAILAFLEAEREAGRAMMPRDDRYFVLQRDEMGYEELLRKLERYASHSDRNPEDAPRLCALALTAIKALLSSELQSSRNTIEQQKKSPHTGDREP